MGAQLAPVDPATRVLLPLIRRGKRTLQEWSVKTVDGAWMFERLEEPGTPWLVWHLPSGLDVPVARLGSRVKCQAFVGSGQAAIWLADRLAERKVQAA